MTDDEALNELGLKTNAESLAGNHWLAAVYGLAINALEKQIPTVAPRPSWTNGAGYTDTFICPACEAHIHMPFMQKECDYNYCPYCGQRWEEDD